MPRPKRARPARSVSSKSGKPNAGEHDGEEQRGRTRSRGRTLRSPEQRMSLEDGNAGRAANRALDVTFGSLAKEDSAVTDGPDDTRGSVEVGRRTSFTPAMRRDTTGLDLADEDVFGDLGDSFADGRVPEAPRSAASSAGNFSHFKATRPRSRQSSIIGRNDPPIRPSSRGPNASGVSSSINIGLFRRRAREPSILATSRRARSRNGSESATSRRSASILALDSGLESEGEFAGPEAESTPSMNRRRSRRGEEHADEAPQLATGRDTRSSRGRRKSDDDVESSEAEQPDTLGQLEAEGGLNINSDSELSELPSPSPPPARLGRPATPINLDEIAAPPASSDSEADSVIWPDIHSLARKRRRLSITTPLRHDGNLSDASSPPSLTHSPNLAANRRRRSAAKQQQNSRPPKVTTADLASLLPKRSYKRNRNELAIDSDDGANSSGGDDDDNHDLSPRPRRRRTAKPASRGTSHARATRAVLKQKQTAAVASVRRSARAASKTYPRSEDKENGGDEEDENDDSQFQPLPDNTFDASTTEADVQNADELKRASRKFKEVDQWELSFEEVAEPPSPPDAR